MDVPFYGFFEQLIPDWALIVALILTILHFGFYGYGIRMWIAASAVFLYGCGAGIALWIVLAVVLVIFGLPFVRRVLSSGIMKMLEALHFLPTISKTEQEAIDAGTTWIEGELFSGRPDFKRILAEDYPGLTADEQAFIDGPTQEVCDATVDWEVFQRRDLSPQTWELLKKHRFFGMIIPKEYGGLGFSASANSAVVGKMSSANAVLGITVMVPNSLGPAELLIHYGTEEQKNYYLPRLASHEEIPAFALTEPNAGSDAGAMEARGEIFKGEDGRLQIRLNWSKRYITLAPISTVLGLAFKLYDPENLLGRGASLGVTCALIPTDKPGVDNGHRHDPLGIPFYNGPTYGHDVIVDLEKSVIGGVAGVGRGWRMLMESLAAGRGISLPAVGTFGTKKVARVAGAHSVVRKQFGLSIGRFEGIEEPLARIGGYSYLLEAARCYTNGALNKGAKPAVVTAIMKYNATELFRRAIDDGMDILGGNAISRGPRNALAHAYINTPIGITVEGANILTRTLIIFGQGAIRSHPWVLKEINALAANDVKAFDRAFWGHIGMVFQNTFRSVLLSLTRGHLAGSPVGGPSARYFRKLAWASASFSIMADMSLGLMGGTLKRKEMITGRYADILSWMYLASATLVRFESEGRRKEDLPLFNWAMDTAFYQMQVAFDNLYTSLRLPVISWFLRGPVGIWSRMNRLSAGPRDKDVHLVARILQTPGEHRDRLTDGIYVPESPERPVGRLDRAMAASVKAEDFSATVKKAVKAKTLPRGDLNTQLKTAVELGLISADQSDLIKYAEKLRDDAVQVDSFTLEEYLTSAIH